VTDQQQQPEVEVLPAAMAVLSRAVEVGASGAQERTRAEVALEKLRLLNVVTADHIVVASGLLQYVKGEWSRIEDQRTSITKPLLEAKRKIDGMFSEALSALVESESVLKRKIADAHLAIQQQNLLAQQAAQAHLQQGDARAAAVASQGIQTMQAPAGVRFADAWTYRIVDASLLPRQFLTADLKKIAAHVKTHGLGMPIPGVTVEKDVSIAAGKK
jgi:hypothetical protein